MSVEIANALSGAGRTAPMPPRMGDRSRDKEEDGFARIMESLPKPEAAPVRATRSNKADPAREPAADVQDAADDYAASDNDIGQDASPTPVEANTNDIQKSSNKSLDVDIKTRKYKDKKLSKTEVLEPTAVLQTPVAVPAVIAQGAPTPDAGNKMGVQVGAVELSTKPLLASVAKSDPADSLQTSEEGSARDPAVALATVQHEISRAEDSDGPAVSARVQEAVKAAPANGQPGKVEKAPAEPKAVAMPQGSSKPVVDTPAAPVLQEAVAASEAAADFPPRAGEATALIQIANDRPSAARRDVPSGDVSVNNTTGEGHDADAASVLVDAAPAFDGKRKPVLPAIAAKLSSFANLMRGNREAQDSTPVMRPAVAKDGVVPATDASTKVEEGDSNPANNGLGQGAGRAADVTAVPGGSVPSTTPAATSATGAAPAAGVGLALGQQVVDMGISGRWIDDIARQIATVAANPGQGSFQLASQTLGAVRVDIIPGTDGSDIMMSVENEAAHAALSNDRQRLLQDAQLASVRLGDVQITRVASLADAQRGDMNNQNQGQGGANGQAAQSAALSQNPQGQGGQPARADMGFNEQRGGGQSQGGTKPQQSRTVLNDGAMGRAAAGANGRADSARYA